MHGFSVGFKSFIRFTFRASLAVTILVAASLAVADPALADPTAKSLPIDECNDPQPDWVFCNCFEDGDLDVWDDWDGNPSSTNLLMSDPGPLGLEGNHVVRLRVPAGQGTSDLVKVLPDTYDRLYARWYAMWEPGYDFTASDHGGGLHAGSRNFLGRSNYRPDGDDWFTSWIDPFQQRLIAYTYYRGMYMDCADPDGSCWGDHFPCLMDGGQTYCTDPAHRPGELPPQLETGRWYCIEMMIDAGDPVSDPEQANGVLNFWIDGQEMGSWTDMWFRTTEDLKLSILWINLYFNGAHSVEGMCVDNVVVSTSPIGCLDRQTPAGQSSWGGLKSHYRLAGANP